MVRVSLSDVDVRGVLPADFDASGSVADFMARLPQLDAPMAARIADLKAQGKVLRFIGALKEGRCSVGMQEVPMSNSLSQVSGGENAVSFLTRRYRPIPLVVRGYGAGPEVTAAGVFADALKTVTFHQGDRL